MILEQQKEAIVLEEGESQDSQKMSLDLGSADFLMQMLSKNIYQDAIGSLIREYVSNALDSHRKAGITEPIRVSLKANSQGNYEFSVQDIGTGLSKEEFMAILTKYGKSTKRESSIELGCFGIGAKSGLAYSSTVYFICRKNGIESKFMMYEGEDKNTIDLLFESPTTEPDGVTVIVPVQRYDVHEFENKMREQLAYFENVYFDNDRIKNDFKITRQKDFQWSELCNDGNLHICLDNVYYPIDFQKLGISNINFPVGLRFSLTDGVFPTINREAIRYTAESKKIILEKIQKVADFFIEKYNYSITEYEDIGQIFDYYSSSSRYIDGYKEGSRLDVKRISEFGTLKFKEPTLKGISHLDLYKIYNLKEYFMEHEIKYYYDYKRFKSVRRTDKLTYYRSFGKDVVYVYETELTKKKQEYLRDVIGNRKVVFVKRYKKIPLGKIKDLGYLCWIKILNLEKVPKILWRKHIEEALYIQSLITKNFVDVENLIIPQEWLDARKKVRVYSTGTREKKEQGVVSCKAARMLQRAVYDKHCKFEAYSVNTALIYKNKYLSVFALENDENMSKFQTYYGLFGNKIQFYLFSEREYKKVNEIKLHNWMPIEQFEKGDNIFFRRLLTAHLIIKLNNQYHYLWTHNRVEEFLGESFKEKINKLDRYRYAYQVYTAPITDFLAERAEENKYYDMKIYHIYEKIKKTFEKLSFMNAFLSVVPSHRFGEKAVNDLLVNLCKFHKIKMDLEKYKKNEETEEENEVI